jgi:chaperonin cofactor prefoldin
MSMEDLRLRVELLTEQKLMIEHRLHEIKRQMAQTTKALEHDKVPASLENNSRRLVKLTERRDQFIAQMSHVERDLFDTKSELIEHDRHNQQSYAGKMFCAEFVDVAKEILPPEMYRHIKDEAIRRGPKKMRRCSDGSPRDVHYTSRV